MKKIDLVLITLFSGNSRRQISDRLDQSIQVTNKVLLVMADNKHIIVAGFWDKSFRIYSVDNAKLEQGIWLNFFIFTFC